MFTQQDFLDQIEAYIAAQGLTPTAFGEKVVKDPNFVFELRKGRSPSLAIVERVQVYMARERAA